MTDLAKQLWSDEDGANAVEYGLIAAVIAVALIAAFIFFRGALQNLFNRQSNQINGQ
jgi:pilus assembly protein Flp/PilA